MDKIDLDKAIKTYEKVLEEKKSSEKGEKKKKKEQDVIVFDNDIPDEYEPNE